MKQLIKILPWFILFILLLGWKSTFALRETYTDDFKNSCKNYLFEENKNQWNNNVKYRISLNRGLAVFLEKSGFTYNFRNIDDLQALMGHNHHKDHLEGYKENTVRLHSVKADFLGSNPEPILYSSEPSSSKTNYFLGNNPLKWAANVNSYKQVNYKNLYKGIDLKLYCDEQNIKYDFNVAPNANPNKIQLKYSGADKLYLSKGNLFVITSLGNIQELKPYAYQQIGRETIEVPCHYNLENNIVSYNFPEGYNESYPLVIDPILIASTYTGSTTDNWGGNRHL